MINEYLFEKHFPDLAEHPFSEWQADWLLSKTSDDVWRIRTDKSKPKTIYFDDILPDGYKLSDDKYKLVSESVKKLVFLMRTGAYAEYTTDTVITRFQQQYDLARSLKIIVKFAVSHNIDLTVMGFSALSELDFDIYNSLAIFGAEHVDGRVRLAKDFLVRQQKKGNLKNYHKKKDGSIDFQKVFAELTKKNDYLKSHRAIYSLKDFRAKPLEQYANNNRAGEFTDTEAVLYEEAANKPVSESTLSTLHAGWKTIGKFSHLLPELKGLEWAANFKTNKIAESLSAIPKGRTKTIPVQTALEYLNHSIQYIVDFGSDIVCLKKDCDQQLLRMFEGTTGRKDHYCKQIKIPENKTAQELNIKRYNRNATNKPISFKRKNFTVEEAVDCLTAACYIVIGTFACKRIDEVLSLTDECIRPSFDGGWELVFGLEKASPAERLALIGRPVPDVVKMATDLLTDITPEYLIENSSDDFIPLFKSSVDVSRASNKLRNMSESTLYKLLTFFADIVQITPIESGYPETRRWYLRTHQLRRFFAITYFWHNKFSNLAALSWFMGHVSPEETMRYISEDISGSEMSEEEARYTTTVMSDDNNENQLPELRQKVKQHFQVDDLNIIPKPQLENYLTQIFESGARITKHFTDHEELLFLEVDDA